MIKNIDQKVIKSINRIDKIFDNVQKNKLTSEDIFDLRKSLADVISYFEEKYITIENFLSNSGNGREIN